MPFAQQGIQNAHSVVRYPVLSQSLPGIGATGLLFVDGHEVLVEAGVLVEVVAIEAPSEGLCGGRPPEGMVLLFTILP